jgi:hypothetical protein
MGGGGGTFAGYVIPRGLREDRLAVYGIANGSSRDTLLILVTGAQKIGTITAGIDSTGAYTLLNLTGDLSF